MEASRGLAAGAIPSVVKVRPKNHSGQQTRWPGPAEILEESSSSPSSTVLYRNYFQKTTSFILTVYVWHYIATCADVPSSSHTIYPLGGVRRWIVHIRDEYRSCLRILLNCRLVFIFFVAKYLILLSLPIVCPLTATVWIPVQNT